VTFEQHADDVWLPFFAPARTEDGDGGR